MKGLMKAKLGRKKNSSRWLQILNLIKVVWWILKGKPILPYRRF